MQVINDASVTLKANVQKHIQQHIDAVMQAAQHDAEREAQRIIDTATQQAAAIRQQAHTRSTVIRADADARARKVISTTLVEHRNQETQKIRDQLIRALTTSTADTRTAIEAQLSNAVTASINEHKIPRAKIHPIQVVNGVLEARATTDTVEILYGADDMIEQHAQDIVAFVHTKIGLPQ